MYVAGLISLSDAKFTVAEGRRHSLWSIVKLESDW